jgi:hypothetical protein
VSVLIKKLREFIGLHSGEKVIVCGCGVSLLEFKEHYSKYITIGVNDVPALFQPTYLLVTDPPSRFNSDSRRKIVNESTAKYLFTCAKGWRHKNLVHFDLGTKDLRHLNSSDKIDHFVNSPYVAVCLAYKLGAKHIGMIGVDFTNGHFYNPADGAHPVVRINYLRKVNTAFSTLRQELEKRGTSFYNLSSESKVEIPKITLEQFDQL